MSRIEREYEVIFRARGITSDTPNTTIIVARNKDGAEREFYNTHGYNVVPVSIKLIRPPKSDTNKNILSLTDKELRALEASLRVYACRSGCAFPEMQDSEVDCYECEYTFLMRSIQTKLVKLKEKR